MKKRTCDETLLGLLPAAGSLAQNAPSGTVTEAVGGPYEGTETRFGVPGSTLFGIAATGSADGAANASYDSFSSLGGGVLLSAVMLGEIAPGGTGSGLYGLIMAVLIAVFVGGLMVGRTPEGLLQRLPDGPALPHSRRPARPGPSRGAPGDRGGHCCRPSHRPLMGSRWRMAWHVVN